MKETSFANASQRPVNEPMALVVTPSISAPEKEDKASKKPAGKRTYRNDYSVAKRNARELFEKFDKSGVFHRVRWNDGEPLRMFIEHVIFFQQRYTWEQFKHDLAFEMASFMSDLRIVRACRTYKLNLFETAQVMAWESTKVKANIAKVGIKNVNAFSDGNSWANKRDLLVCSEEELAPYFKSIGLEEDDWSSPWLVKHSEEEEVPETQVPSAKKQDAEVKQGD